MPFLLHLLTAAFGPERHLSQYSDSVAIGGRADMADYR